MTEAVNQLANALAVFLEQQRDSAVPVSVSTSRYVTVALAAAKTGLTEKAIRRKIEDGHWVEGAQWRRAPDGHVMVDMQGVERWVEKAMA